MNPGAPGPNHAPDAVGERLRARMIDSKTRAILVTDFRGTKQEADLSEPPNCGGVGRVRHYQRETSPGWPPNPLPIDPSSRALSKGPVNELRAQLFQNAGCNWRCWYCFVPFELLGARQESSSWVSADELVQRFAGMEERPDVIVLSGGQPDLTPEWVPWMIEAIKDHGIADTTYLWSDDNLSNDFFWRYLSQSQIEIIAGFSNYGRVGCFKGFDAESFAYNTGAPPESFDRQFDLFGRLLDLGLDIYAYVTLTTPTDDGLPDALRRFVDRLQALSPTLPLRTVPLEIRTFHAMEHRISPLASASMSNQWRALDAWAEALAESYGQESVAEWHGRSGMA